MNEITARVIYIEAYELKHQALNKENPQTTTEPTVTRIIYQTRDTYYSV